MSDTTNIGLDGKVWPQTMDAKIWADEFCKRNSASDHGTMLGWFANAIMIGYDTASCQALDRFTPPFSPPDLSDWDERVYFEVARVTAQIAAQSLVALNSTRNAQSAAK